MPDASELDERVSFQKKALDANGRKLGDWTEQFQRFVKITWLRGSVKGAEPVMQNRLQGIRPAIFVVREDNQVRTVNNDWRLVGVTPRILDVVFDIKTGPTRGDDGFLDILAEDNGGPGGP